MYSNNHAKKPDTTLRLFLSYSLLFGSVLVSMQYLIVVAHIEANSSNDLMGLAPVLSNLASCGKWAAKFKVLSGS